MWRLSWKKKDERKEASWKDENNALRQWKMER